METTITCYQALLCAPCSALFGGGGPQSRGFFAGPYNKDYSVLGPILGSPIRETTVHA